MEKRASRNAVSAGEDMRAGQKSQLCARTELLASNPDLIRKLVSPTFVEEDAG